MKKILLFLLSVFLFIGTASAQSVYYPAYGNGNGTFSWISNRNPGGMA